MSSPFSLEAVVERDASAEADAVGAILAESPGWVSPFVVLLSGLTFKTLPSMTTGGVVFELSTGRDGEGRRLLSALDEVYREIRDGYEAGYMHGEMLERYVWHSLGKAFPDRLGACAVHREGAAISSYSLDGATSTTPPAVSVEAKTSERALVGRNAPDRLQHAAKAAWVVALRDETEGNVLGIFVTWAAEDRFRAVLEGMTDAAVASAANIIGHEQVAQLPGRVAGFLRRLG